MATAFIYQAPVSTLKHLLPSTPSKEKGAWVEKFDKAMHLLELMACEPMPA
jgi:hypothetical protein